ncbi:MAG: hypothetical protein IJJ25_00730 [Lachnospiraceae bacterium]|nr:hypothetical protein [Lachnospiraceae bacterium]
MAFTLFERWSPEYALNNTIEDIKASGLDGLKKHLTANALKNVQSMEAIASRPEIALFTSALMGGNAVGVFLEKLSECEWTIRDVMKGSTSSKAILSFDYQDMMTGTLELTMIKEDKIWKIDGLAMPKFEKLALPQGNTEQS